MALEWYKSWTDGGMRMTLLGGSGKTVNGEDQKTVILALFVHGEADKNRLHG